MRSIAIFLKMYRLFGQTGLWLLLSLPTGLAYAADLAWTLDRTSAGLQAVDRPVVVAYEPDAASAAGALANSRITQVYASRDYQGQAQVHTELCWGSAMGPCVPISGRHLNTNAFNGKPAHGPLLLVHRVDRWVTDHPPLFVRGTITVWYTNQPLPPAR